MSGNTLSAGNAYSSAMFYMVTYVLTTLGSFGTIMYLSHQGFEAEEIDDFAGLNSAQPWAAGVMAMFLSLAGIPPMVGFYAKLSVLQALVDQCLVLHRPGHRGGADVAGGRVLLPARRQGHVASDSPRARPELQASAAQASLGAAGGQRAVLFGLLPGGRWRCAATPSSRR